MEPEKPVLNSNSGSEKKSGPWRPTRRQVLWAVGTLLALVTIALLVGLLVVNLDAVKWEDLSRERIEQVALFIGIAVALTTLFVLLAIGGASLGWTGFADKKFWDWLQLLSALAIPVVLAAAGLWFTAQQDTRQQNIEDRRAQQAQKIENQRAAAERELAEQRAQDEALQTYIDQMGSLLLEKDLRESKEDSEVRTLARARTLTVLGRLDPSRKTAVMQFLAEAKLLQNVEGRGAIITFSGADLSGANLTDAADNLSGADLSDADLSGANLSCNRSVIFFGFGASQRCSDLSDANLFRADLSGADLYSADLVGANLLAANLSGADLSFAVLRDADLRVADLRDANLRDANLSGADLSFAVLSGANLRHAHLSGAVGITNEELDQQAASLEGATMPNGQKYDDWLKSKDQENKKSDGSS